MRQGVDNPSIYLFGSSPSIPFVFMLSVSIFGRASLSLTRHACLSYLSPLVTRIVSARFCSRQSSVLLFLSIYYADFSASSLVLYICTRTPLV